MTTIIGKTIQSVTHYGIEDLDDKPFIQIDFTDGTSCHFKSSYGGYTGNSVDEYPSLISIKDGPVPPSVDHWDTHNTEELDKW